MTSMKLIERLDSIKEVDEDSLELMLELRKYYPKIRGVLVELKKCYKHGWWENVDDTALRDMLASLERGV